MDTKKLLFGNNIACVSKASGIVLYPKGFCFNPLNYIEIITPPIVIFNACRREELQYGEKKLYPKLSINTLLTITGCTLKDMKQVVKNSFLKNIHWYFLTKKLKERLKLRGTTSIINAYLKEKKIKVKVINIFK